MSDIKRVDPRRPYQLTPEGIRRIVLGDTAHAPAAPMSFHASHPKGKPARPRQATTAWHMAVAHSNRGRLEDPARQAIAAAAILAGPETGVLAVILGPLHEDIPALGADIVAILPDYDAQNFSPERDVALISSLIAVYDPRHIFMADTQDGDGDLGRRLIVKHRATAAAHVIELTRTHVTISWSGGAELARTELPRFVLLSPGAVDAVLTFVGEAKELAAADLATAKAAPSSIRDLGLESLDATAVSLEEADFIVSAGNGVKNVQTTQSTRRRTWRSGGGQPRRGR